MVFVVLDASTIDVVNNVLNSHRAVPFLAAFNDIERFLRGRLDAPHHDSFSRMVREAERRHILRPAPADTLLEYAELRNAISHGQYDAQFRPIAEPNVDTLATIEKIRDELLHPQSALQLLGNQKVATYLTTTTIGELLGAKHGKYPVYSEGSFIALLYDADIVAWLNRQRGNSQSVVTLDLDTPVSALINAAAAKRCIFMDRHTTAATVIKLLTTPVDGHLPRAGIINESGRLHQKPLRIVTGTELALLVKNQ